MNRWAFVIEGFAVVFFVTACDRSPLEYVEVSLDHDSDTEMQEGGNNSYVDASAALVWHLPSGANQTWADAEKNCSDMADGPWRMPNIDELRSLLRMGLGEDCYANSSNGDCGVTEVDVACLDRTCADSCTNCDTGYGPGLNGCYWDAALTGECDFYWSSSECPDCVGVGVHYWGVRFQSADLIASGGEETGFVICVRNATLEELADIDDTDTVDTDTSPVIPGIIYGIVTYNDGLDLSFAATVSAKNLADASIYTTKTDELGEYELSVPPGFYSVRADYPGYYDIVDRLEVLSGASIKVVMDMI